MTTFAPESVRRLTPELVARRFNVNRVTVVKWCEAGTIPAINVAGPSASRKRWRMSEDDIEEFERRRENRSPAGNTNSRSA